MLWLLGRSSAWNRENGDLLGTPNWKRSPWGPGDPLGSSALEFNFYRLPEERGSPCECVRYRSLSFCQVCSDLVSFSSPGWSVTNGHHVADLQFVNKPLKRTLTNSLTYKKKLNNTAFKPPFSPGLGPLLLKIRPPFGPSSKIKGSPFFCLWYTTI